MTTKLHFLVLISKKIKSLQDYEQPRWYVCVLRENRDGVVNIATKLRAGRPRNCGSISSKFTGLFSSLKRLYWLWVLPKDSFPGLKGSGCEADYLPPHSTYFKSKWSYKSSPPCAFTACKETTWFFTFTYAIFCSGIEYAHFIMLRLWHLNGGE
jgi:hypothetical protein